MRIYYKPRHSTNRDKPMASMVTLDYTLVSFASNCTLSYTSKNHGKFFAKHVINLSTHSAEFHVMKYFSVVTRIENDISHVSNLIGDRRISRWQQDFSVACHQTLAGRVWRREYS